MSSPEHIRLNKKVELHYADNSFFKQFESRRKRNYSDLEILWELEFKGRKIK